MLDQYLHLAASRRPPPPPPPPCELLPLRLLSGGRLLHGSSKNECFAQSQRLSIGQESQKNESFGKNGKGSNHSVVLGPLTWASGP